MSTSKLEYIGGRAIALPPRKQVLLDALRDAGDAGLTLEAIHSAVWKRGPLWQHEPSVTPLTILTHIRQLNALLTDSDLRVASTGHGVARRRWFLTSRHPNKE